MSVHAVPDSKNTQTSPPQSKRNAHPIKASYANQKMTANLSRVPTGL